jgi:hypothetical protein
MGQIKLLLVLLISLPLLAGCTDGSGARRVLEAQGFREIEITGYRFWGCGEQDTYKTGFSALAVSGDKVTGIVCGGWLKGSTVRFD